MMTSSTTVTAYILTITAISQFVINVTLLIAFKHLDRFDIYCASERGNSCIFFEKF